MVSGQRNQYYITLCQQFWRAKKIIANLKVYQEDSQNFIPIRLVEKSNTCTNSSTDSAEGYVIVTPFLGILLLCANSFQVGVFVQLCGLVSCPGCCPS